ncbi:hypothetical protein PMAYCL1PPCAC_17053 [Pristionchus mayeri]|uniref:Uncharacterized protein n=1 Tax=Pristionchus mayeri TaxID=1317129 RepID=A0AAN5HZY6_9BILA|nr:hypothetical protein PMAYCL1PPCAC_17053 [Pristionchus mayeri]
MRKVGIRQLSSYVINDIELENAIQLMTDFPTSKYVMETTIHLDEERIMGLPPMEKLDMNQCSDSSALPMKKTMTIIKSWRWRCRRRISCSVKKFSMVFLLPSC